MTKAKKAPLSRTEDCEAQFINYQEEFRRSKRNSLVWSSLLFLGAVASIPGKNDSGVLRIAGTSFLVPQSLLVIMLAIAATFFFLSYVRSLSVIIPLNSEIAKNTDELWADSESIMKGIKSKLSGPNDSANEIINKISNINRHIESVNSSSTTLASTIELDIDNQNFIMAVENFDRALSDTTGSIGGMQRSARSLIDMSSIRHTRAITALETWKSEYSEENARLKSYQSNVDDRIAQIISDVEGIENSLSTFRSAILGREKAWHWSLDRIAIMSLFGLSLAVAAWRISSPIGLDSAAQWFADEPPAIVNVQAD